jgi:hypothetical protein
MNHKFTIKPFFVAFAIFATANAMAQTHSLVAGWNLEGNDTGAKIDPNTSFGNALIPTSASPNIVTVWTWDKAANRWNFFAPSMASANLKTYADSKG